MTTRLDTPTSNRNKTWQREGNMLVVNNSACFVNFTIGKLFSRTSYNSSLCFGYLIIEEFTSYVN